MLSNECEKTRACACVCLAFFGQNKFNYFILFFGIFMCLMYLFKKFVHM